MIGPPGVTSGGQVPISRLQVKRSTHLLSLPPPKPAAHDPASIGTRQRRAVPPPSVSTNTTYSHSSPWMAQVLACRLPSAENAPPATASHARMPSHRQLSL